MEEQFKQHIARLVSLAQQKKYLLAVSGGADSSVMAQLFFKGGYSFAIAHCNFHLRGDDSNQDMELVRTKAKQYGVPYFEKEFDTRSFQRESGLSLEMAARQLRYDWFSQIDGDFDYVVTAHNANDNAETFLLNMTRGTGLKGLTAIPEISGKLLRPLLSFSSAQIRNYAAENGIAYRNDATNFSEDFQRNKIRHAVIPKLEELNPELIKTFSRNIFLLKKQHDFYQQQMEIVKEKLICNEDNMVRINIDELSKNDNNLLILNEILRDYNFTPAMVRQIWTSAEAGSGKQFFSKTHWLVKDRQSYIISPLHQYKFLADLWTDAQDEVQNKQKTDNAEIRFEDVMLLEKMGFTIERFSAEVKPDYKKNDKVLFVDAEKFNPPYLLRYWREGDRFHPLGMNGSKKLSDFFVDMKFSLPQKKNVLVLCAANKIAWLVGIRSDDRFKIDTQTKIYYKITYHGSI